MEMEGKSQRAVCGWEKRRESVILDSAFLPLTFRGLCSAPSLTSFYKTIDCHVREEWERCYRKMWPLRAFSSEAAWWLSRSSSSGSYDDVAGTKYKGNIQFLVTDIHPFKRVMDKNDFWKTLFACKKTCQLFDSLLNDEKPIYQSFSVWM